MSKIDIGVGEDFPLDEAPAGNNRHAWREMHRGHRHAFHGHHGHRHHHHRHGFLHFPLILAVAGIAALIGAGKIPALAAEVILGVAAVLVVFAVVGHIYMHRSWHADRAG